MSKIGKVHKMEEVQVVISQAEQLCWILGFITGVFIISAFTLVVLGGRNL